MTRIHDMPHFNRWQPPKKGISDAQRLNFLISESVLTLVDITDSFVQQADRPVSSASTKGLTDGLLTGLLLAEASHGSEWDALLEPQIQKKLEDTRAGIETRVNTPQGTFLYHRMFYRAIRNTATQGLNQSDPIEIGKIARAAHDTAHPDDNPSERIKTFLEGYGFVSFINNALIKEVARRS